MYARTMNLAIRLPAPASPVLLGRRLGLLLALLLVPGCPSTPLTVEKPAAPEPLDLSSLTIPVSDRDVTVDVLAEIAESATLTDRDASGDGAAHRERAVEAAWARAHYLLDLFDDARFARDDSSLAVLHRALGLPGPPARGKEATDLILASLDAAVDKVLALDPEHADARAAKSLLAFDLQPPARRALVFRQMKAVKTAARGDSAVVGNARLRLAGYCARALVDAATARYAERIERVAHCLYPLYDANPEPYFAAHPERQPPPPDWRHLASELDSMFARVASSDTRLARAGGLQRQFMARFVSQKGGEMPTPPDLIGLPALARATPYHWTPLVTRTTLDQEATEALGRAVAGDERSTLAIALQARAPASEVVAAAALARTVGAEKLELVGAGKQTLRAPRGDYWHSRSRDGEVGRAGVVTLSLAPYAGMDDKQTRFWDPARATLGLHLVVASDTWQLVAPSGSMPAVTTASATGSGSTGPEAALRAQLRDVRAAYPEQDSLRIVANPDASAGSLVRAVAASLRDARGRPLMRRVALAGNPPVSRGNRLAQSVARRKGARVAIEPRQLAVRTSVVRACYQDHLERRAGTRGRYRLERTAPRTGAEKQVRVVSGPRDARLRRCVLEAMTAIMNDRDSASAEITLDPG